jgi:hypothetical protein
MLFQMSFKTERKSGGRYQMNSAYLQDKEIVKQLKEQWVSCPQHMLFFGKLRKVTKWYKELSIRKAKE